jgi:hypothetical protein
MDHVAARDLPLLKVGVLVSSSLFLVCLDRQPNLQPLTRPAFRFTLPSPWKILEVLLLLGTLGLALHMLTNHCHPG